MNQRIFSLGSQHFLTGMSTSPYDDVTSTWDALNGIDIFSQPGVLRSGSTTTDISGTIVTDNIKWFVSSFESNAHYLYGHGDTGRMYKVTVSTNTPVSQGHLFDTSNSQGQGLSIGEGTSGSAAKIIYTKDTACRSNSIPPTAGNDTSLTGVLTDSLYHPVYFGPDKNWYIGDVNEVDSYDGSTYSTNVLDLPATITITCFEDDGNYLIIGATNNPAVSAYGKSVSKVYFWDMWSETWNKEWDIPDASVRALKKIGPWIYCWGGRGLWRFTYSNPPERVLAATISSTDPIDYRPGPNGITIHNGILMWGDGSRIAALGSPDNRLGNAVYRPFKNLSGISANRGVVFSIDISKLYAGDNNKLYEFGSGGNCAGTATTSLIDLKRTWRITGVKLIMKALASGESIEVAVENDAGTDILAGAARFDDDGAITSKYIRVQRGAKTLADQVIINLTLRGNAELKRVDLFGDPNVSQDARS